MSRTIDLAASGKKLRAVTFDSNVVLLVGDQPHHHFRIETDLVLSTEKETVVVHFAPYESPATDPQHLDDLATLIGRQITTATADTHGLLRLTFDDAATSLTVHPLDRYEAWTYVHGNYILPCPPGGEMNPRPETDS